MDKNPDILLARFLLGGKSRPENSDCKACETPEKTLKEESKEITDYLLTGKDSKTLSWMKEMLDIKNLSVRDYIYHRHAKIKPYECSVLLYKINEVVSDNRAVGRDAVTEKLEVLKISPHQEIEEGTYMSAHWKQLIEDIDLETMKPYYNLLMEKYVLEFALK